MPALTLFKKLVVVVAFAGMLGACGASFRSDVATFHTLTGGDGLTVEGQSVNLITIDPEKAKSLEYGQYASVIGGELNRVGYMVTGEEQGEYEVAFDIAISDGREKLETRPGAFGGVGFYGGCLVCRANGNFWGLGPFGFGGLNQELVARTVYHTELTIHISKRDGERVFEGRAEADVRGNKLAETVPLLARSLFKDFPGESGVTRRVVLSAEERESLEQKTLNQKSDAR